MYWTTFSPHTLSHSFNHPFIRLSSSNTIYSLSTSCITSLLSHTSHTSPHAPPMSHTWHTLPWNSVITSIKREQSGQLSSSFCWAGLRCSKPSYMVVCPDLASWNSLPTKASSEQGQANKQTILCTINPQYTNNIWETSIHNIKKCMLFKGYLSKACGYLLDVLSILCGI